MTNSYRNVERTSEFAIFGSLEYIRYFQSSRFIVRDFVYSEEQIHKQREELDSADTTEKELWVLTFFI